MLPPLFYLLPKNIDGEFVELNETESHHAKRVLRLKLAAPVMIVDGNGIAYKGEISKITARSNVQIRIHNEIRNFGEPSVHLTLACGMSTNFKFDSIIQKGTELGVSRFVPLITEKSMVKLDDPKRSKSKIKRYQKIAIASMKQCRRSFCPTISYPLKLDDFLKTSDEESLNLIFHLGSEKPKKLKDILGEQSLKRITILVGPESGFSEYEISCALDKHFHKTSLGIRILRAETAAPVATALVMSHFEELS